MAHRPVFVPRTRGSRLVEEAYIEFAWHPGFAPSQKKKNIECLHKAAAKEGLLRILEVSTKSSEELGRFLSAFNLTMHVAEVGIVTLENAYQASKVFLKGGPFTDLNLCSALEAKRDVRLRESGPLKSFTFEGRVWSLEPKTAFYDWLYIKAIFSHRELFELLDDFDGFTDIEFNPGKSINCQARACAIFVSLMRKGLLESAVGNPEFFIELVKNDVQERHIGDVHHDLI